MLQDEAEDEVATKPTKHFIDFDLTVKHVISEIKSKFPATMKDCEESNFVKNSRIFVNSLIEMPEKLEQVLKTVPSQCKYCEIPLNEWRHKTPKSYFLSMGHLKQIQILVKLCPKCRRAYYPSFYENGILFIHNKFMLTIESILDLSQILKIGGGFVGAVKGKLLLLGQLEGLLPETLEKNLNNTALDLEKTVITVMSLILKGSDLDEVLCYLCGICPKICCTDGNTKVRVKYDQLVKSLHYQFRILILISLMSKANLTSNCLSTIGLTIPFPCL